MSLERLIDLRTQYITHAYGSINAEYAYAQICEIAEGMGLLTWELEQWAMKATDLEIIDRIIDLAKEAEA